MGVREDPLILVWVRLQFIGFHRWKDAPSAVQFLRDWHRHVFHIRLAKRVTEVNREIEFLQLKQKVQKYVDSVYVDQPFEASCEQIALGLYHTFDAYLVEVSEDGENGATVISKEVKTDLDGKEYKNSAGQAFDPIPTNHV